VGSGTEFGKLEDFFREKKPQNMRLMEYLPKEDYDRMVAACDVGMIFLDHRFTIPNFPSRLLSYMQVKIPVLACTDPNTDIGRIIVDGGFGWWNESNDVEAFCRNVQLAAATERQPMGEKAFAYLKAHYSSEEGYRIIEKHLA
jgi:glycosyltransferase involved in cell wall biosynthesis